MKYKINWKYIKEQVMVILFALILTSPFTLGLGLIVRFMNRWSSLRVEGFRHVGFIFPVIMFSLCVGYILVLLLLGVYRTLKNNLFLKIEVVEE